MKLLSATLFLLSTALFFGCAPKSQRLDSASLHSTLLHKEVGFSVLRAPSLPGVDGSTLPVVLFLHGMGSDHLAFDEFGVSDALHRAMLEGRIPPVHFVLPDGERGFYLNWYDGSLPYEDYILNEVLPRAEALLGVRDDVERHIAGVSMGGIGALQIGLRHPDRFASIACISSVILTRDEAKEMMERPLIRLFVPVKRVWGDGTDDSFSDSINPFRLAASLTPQTAPRIFLANGTDERDSIQRTTVRYAQQLKRLGLPHNYVKFDGEHTWRDWVPVIEAAVRDM